MVLIRLRPKLARLLISPVTTPHRGSTFEYLEREIKGGRWDKVPPIWLTPNFIIPGIAYEKFGFSFDDLIDLPFRPFFQTERWGNFSDLLLPLRPFIIYDGHHRYFKALENKLPVNAYVRYTPCNPPFTGSSSYIDDGFYF